MRPAKRRQLRRSRLGPPGLGQVVPGLLADFGSVSVRQVSAYAHRTREPLMPS